MRAFFLLLLFCVTCLPVASSQPDAPSLSTGKNFRIRLGLGLATFTAKRQLKMHFDRHGFDEEGSDILNLDFYPSTYPHGEGFALTPDLTLERRLNRHGWVGLAIGADNSTKVLGFNGKHQAELGQASWFLSPQIAFEIPEKNFGFRAGPTLDFHKQDDEPFDDEAAKKRFTKPGFLAGIFLRSGKRYEFSMLFRWAAKFHFGAREYTPVSLGLPTTSKLPAQDMRFSYLRLGVSYGLEIGNQ